MKIRKKLLIIAGGTGGHIIPAVTIGLNIKDTDVKFVCGNRDIEKTIYESFNIKPFIMDIGSFSPLNFAKKLPQNIVTAFKMILSEDIDTVLITGNYSSVPAGIASVILQKKILVIEQDAIIGKANMIFSRFAQAVFVAFPKKFAHVDNKKTIYLGHIIRKEIIAPKRYKEDSIEKTEKKTILIIGGSQGAKLMSEKVIDILSSKKDLRVIAITGKFTEYFKKYENIETISFCKNMGYIYSLSDLIIARSGAISLAEISATNKPALFIPLPSAKNHEQRKNVREYMRTNGQFDYIDEEKLNQSVLLKKIDALMDKRGKNDYSTETFNTQMDKIGNYV